MLYNFVCRVTTFFYFRSDLWKAFHCEVIDSPNIQVDRGVYFMRKNVGNKDGFIALIF
jgi:hypothetical protein